MQQQYRRPSARSRLDDVQGTCGDRDVARSRGTVGHDRRLGGVPLPRPYPGPPGLAGRRQAPRQDFAREPRSAGNTRRVRTKPLIGHKVWFGPRRLGWGLSPVTAEGWAVVVIGVAAAIVLAFIDRYGPWLSLIPVAVILILTFLKGTSPGGPDAWEEFQATRDGNRDS